MCCEDNLRVPNELSRGLHDVLVFEAVRILTTFFLELKSSYTIS